MKSIKSVFDTICNDLIVDQHLLKVVRRYEQQFVNKNENHINFFGGILMGVHPVRFTQDDRLRFFEEIVGKDEIALMQEIHALPTVNTSWKVSSDTMNLACLYMIHRFLISPDLTPVQREEGALLIAQIMNYKFFTSTLTGWFTYNANPIVAQTTYAMLTRKFGLKVAGSWGVLIRNRSYDIVKKGGLHYNTLIKFEPDKKIVDMANDTWGRVKSILKYIRDVFTVAQNMPEYQIQNVSNTITLDGEIRLRDKSRSISQYMDYIQSTIQDKRSFIKRDLVNVIMQVMGNVPIKSFDLVLEYMVNNSSIKADKDIQAFLNVVVEHGINYITQNPGVMRNKSDLAGLIRKMKGLYTSAKTSDPLIMEIRRIGERISERGGKTRNKQVISALRNAIALYVILRTMVMHHYEK